MHEVFVVTGFHENKQKKTANITAAYVILIITLKQYFLQNICIINLSMTDNYINSDNLMDVG